MLHVESEFLWRDRGFLRHSTQLFLEALHSGSQADFKGRTWAPGGPEESRCEVQRVVVTGLGMVSPLGLGVDASWKALIAGKSGARRLTGIDVEGLACKIACPVVDCDVGFQASEFIPDKEVPRFERFIHLGVAAAAEAVTMAKLDKLSEDDKDRIGVMMGSGIGGFERIASTMGVLEARGPRRISPFFVPAVLVNMLSGYVSIRHGFRGPNHAVATACATGAHAIGDAARLIMFGDADVMVAGSAESSISRLALAGFGAARALSTGFNDAPVSASRPWDRDRDGFVMGEGAGALILESLDYARKRGATILAEVVGYGLSGDAHHITAPAEDGNGAYRAMGSALKQATLAPSAIDYINAHGTSTPRGDDIELAAVERLLEGVPDHSVSMSSTKSSIGHLLGGAGSVEAIFAIQALRHQVVPPTLNLENPSRETSIDLVPLVSKERRVKTVLSNSFGFGGTNASLLFKAFDG